MTEEQDRELELRIRAADQSLAPSERKSAISDLADYFKEDQQWEKVPEVYLAAAEDSSIPNTLRHYCLREAAEWMCDVLSQREESRLLMESAFSDPSSSAKDRFLAKEIYWEADDDRDRANAVLESAIADPESDHLIRASVRLKLTDWINIAEPERALQLCQDQIDDPESVPHNRTAARHAMSLTYRLHHRFDEELAVLQDDIDDPRSTPAEIAGSRGLLGERLTKSDPVRAAEAFWHNINDPNTPDEIRPLSRKTLIPILRAEGKQSEVQNQLKQLISDPGSTRSDKMEAMRAIADSLRSAGPEEAIAWYRQLLEQPEIDLRNVVWAKRNIGLLLAESEPAAALAVLGELASDPRLPPFIQSTGLAYMQTVRAGEVTEELIHSFDMTAPSRKDWP